MMASKPRNSDLPLLCALGFHSAGAMAHWNHGYYFSRCRRCDTDLVRTAYSGWHVPRGHRVVWRSHPPASHVEVELAPEEPPVADAADEAAAEVADRIVEEGRDQSEPAGEDAALAEAGDPDPEPGEEIPAASERPWRDAAALSVVPDFMGDGGVGQAIRTGSREPFAPPSDHAEASGDPSGASWLHRLTYRPDIAAEQRSSAEDRRLYIRFAAIGGFLLVVALAWALLATRALPPRVAGAPPAVLAEPSPPAPVVSPPSIVEPDEGSFVTASLLNCRSAPATQARSLRRLARGQQVRVLAREAEWASIAVAGEQCWVQDRYIAAAQPMS